MPENLSPAEIKFYDAFDEARQEAGGQTAYEINSWMRKLRRDPTALGQPAPILPAEPWEVPESTIRGWMDRRCLPRDEGDLFLVITVLRALRESQRRPSFGRPGKVGLSTEEKTLWRSVWRVAKAGRDERRGRPVGSGNADLDDAGKEPPQAPPQPSTAPAAEDSAVGGTTTAAQPATSVGAGPTATVVVVVPPSPPPRCGVPAESGPVARKPWRAWLQRHVGVVATVGGAAVIVSVLGVVALAASLGEPKRQCAIVTTKDGAPAPVWEYLDRPKLKDKRAGELVELYPQMGTTDTPAGVYQAVLLREGGRNTYGWMLKAHLRAAECNPR